MRFKAKMKLLDPDWADQIWEAATRKNQGNGPAWLLPLAALAITGCRPVSLERGIEFSVKQEKGQIYIEATVPGAKLLLNADGTPKRGQKEVVIRWHMRPGAERDTHRPRELEALSKALFHAPGRSLTVRYDGEAISTRLRELSRELWPRRRHHVSGVCYRELFSAESKAAGVKEEDIAAAMGHLSTESQGRYASANRRRRKGAAKPPRSTFTKVSVSASVRTDRGPMARFKRASAIKKLIKA